MMVILADLSNGENCVHKKVISVVCEYELVHDTKKMLKKNWRLTEEKKNKFIYFQKYEHTFFFSYSSVRTFTFYIFNAETSLLNEAVL